MCNHIKKIIFLFIFIATNAIATPADDLSKHLDSFQTMTANFLQTVNSGAGIQQSSGSVAIQRPGKFRWSVNKPSQQLIIANDNTVWIYDADLEQATKQRLTESQQKSPAMLLSGKTTDILQRFNVTTVKPSSGNGVGYKLTPKSSDDLFQYVELYFTNDKLTGMRLMDNLGTLSTFQFTNVKINQRLPSNLFIFIAPPHVDVISN